MVGLSIYNYRFRPDFIVIFISAFVVHELAHKFLAQFYRAWAEFRVIFFGAVITALSAIPLWPFKFIAPGAVMVSGNLSSGRNGKISWIGPITNIAMCAGYLAVYFSMFHFGSSAPPRILLVGAQFNGIIALFNLIPLMGLDGEKIFWWNKIVWITTVAGAGALYLITDFMTGGPVSRTVLPRL
jgi:Zn-dependent protease